MLVQLEAHLRPSGLQEEVLPGSYIFHLYIPWKVYLSRYTGLTNSWWKKLKQFIIKLRNKCKCVPCTKAYSLSGLNLLLFWWVHMPHLVMTVLLMMALSHIILSSDFLATFGTLNCDDKFWTWDTDSLSYKKRLFVQLRSRRYKSMHGSEKATPSWSPALTLSYMTTGAPAIKMYL